MSRVALWNVTIRGLLAVAMMGMVGSFPAQAGSKTVLQGKLVTCPDAAGMFCLQRADGRGTVTLLNVNEEAPMYFMRAIDTLITMEIDVAVEGVLKSPTAYAANDGLTVRWGNKEVGLDAGSIHPSDDAADAGSVQETTLQELGGLLEANQARALMLYGGAPGFLLKGKALEFKVETNEKGEKLATVLIGPPNINSRSVDPTLGEKARILCYMDLASASQFKQGQVVMVSGVINDIRKIRYYYQFGEMWLTPFLVITYPCRLSPTP